MDKNNKTLSQSSSEAAKTSSSNDERRIAINLSRRIGVASKPASATSEDSNKQSVNSTLNTSQATPKTSANDHSVTDIAPAKVNITANTKEATLQNTPVQSDPQDTTQPKSQSTQDKVAQAIPPKSLTSNKTQESAKATQEANGSAPIAQYNNETKSDNNNKERQTRGSTTPPWMAKYQKKSKESSSDESSVHIDLTSKTKQEQSNRERLEKQRTELESEFAKALDFVVKKANGPKPTKKQEQRLKEIEEYTSNNFFDLDLFAFQKSFDNIDKILGEYLHEHFDFINSLIANESINDFVKLHLNEDNLDLFTSKKSKYKHKQRLTSEQLESTITDYLRFKYTGIFKAVCMYQLFCEQFRVEIFNQLEKQCRDFSSEHAVVDMGELQRLIDDIEPIEVAANKLMRLSLSESQIVSYDLTNSFTFNDLHMKYISERSYSQNTGDDVKREEEVLRNKINRYSEFNSQLFNFTAQDAGHDPELQALADKVNVEMVSQEDLKELGCPKLSDSFADLFSKSSMSDRSNVSFFNCKQLNEICSILSVYDGYYSPCSDSIENLDDGMMSNGNEWISNIAPHLNVATSTKNYQFLDWLMYWRLDSFADTMQRGNDLFIDADACIKADQNYIFACPESNFKRNLEQLNLCFRQIVGKRDALYRYQKPGNDKDVNVYLNEYTNVTDNSFAMIVQFVIGLSLPERLIFSAILNGIDSNYEMILCCDNIRAKFDNKNDAYKNISDTDIIMFCLKLTDTILVEKLILDGLGTVSLEDAKFVARIRLTPTLIKHVNETKQMLSMYSTISSLTMRMNQELLYINPALRTMFECCETLMHNRSLSTTSNMLTKLEQTLQDEIAYNKLRNHYIELMQKEGNPLNEGLDNDILIRAMHALPMSIKSRMDLDLFAESINASDFDYDDDDEEDDDDYDDIDYEFLAQNSGMVKDTFNRLCNEIDPSQVDKAQDSIQEIMKHADNPESHELANAILGIFKMIKDYKSNN